MPMDVAGTGKTGARIEPDATKPQVSRISKAIDDWLNAPKKTSHPIPAGVDQFGDIRIRSGISDPFAEEGKPTSVLERLLAGANTFTGGNLTDAIPEGSKVDPLQAGFVSPLATAADVINDVNTRVGNFRKWRADDPFSDKDKPEFEYELPSGKTFETKDQLDYYKLSDGSVLSSKELKDLKPDESTWTLRNGMQLTTEDFDSLKPANVEWVDKNDKRWDGKTVDSAGSPVVVGSYELPNGKVISAEALVEPKLAFYTTSDGKRISAEAAEGEREFAHWAFPDGTITAQADGTVPEVMQNIPHRQTNEDFWGVVDPRSPLQDTAGNWMWDEEYQLKNSAIDETPAWLADMVLNSAPYFVPHYNLASGAAAAAPYVSGYQGDTYMPTGRDFHDLGGLGAGTYKAGTQLEDGTQHLDGMTNAQMIGGIMSPLVDAIMERAGGKAIGGLADKLPKGVKESVLGQFIENNPIGRVLSAAAGEGIEEVASSPFQQLQQEGWENLGREYTRNDKTGEIEFDMNTPKYGSMPETMLQDFLAGSIMGGLIGGPGEVGTALKNRRTGGPALKVPQAPRRTDAELRALERHYRED